MIPYKRQIQIQKEVVLGLRPARPDTAEEKVFRESVQKDNTAAKAIGGMLSFPNDWED